MARIGKKEKEAMRQNILETSKKMFIEQGYDKTSTSQIAKAVGIAEGTVFNYFKSKSDILIDIFSTDYFDTDKETLKIDVTIGVVEMYCQLYEKVMSKVILLPKKIILEMFLTISNATKKRPELLKKLADQDFKFLGELEKLTLLLQDSGMITSCDAKLLSENIFSVITYELLLYLYEKDMSKNEMYDNITKKIHFMLEHRITIKE